MNIQEGLIATKVRGIASHQDFVSKIMQGEISVEHVYIAQSMRVIVKTMDGEAIPVGRLDTKYNGLRGKQLRIKSWRLTGGEPTDIIGKYGRLMKTIGMNLMIEVKEPEPVTPA